MKTKKALGQALGLALVFLCTNVSADYGDYSAWHTFLYKRGWKSPPGPNNPVESSDLVGKYPLVKLKNKQSDGFSPKKYDHWQLVTLGPESNATCMDGSPYRFAVRRSAKTSNVVMEYQGGGACWDWETCVRGEGLLSAINTDGIPDDFLLVLGVPSPPLPSINPFTWASYPQKLIDWAVSVPANFGINQNGIQTWGTSPIYNKWSAEVLSAEDDNFGLKGKYLNTVEWSVVFAPYCTGDVHLGDNSPVYIPEDPGSLQPGEPAFLRASHSGIRNQRAIASWVKDNLPRPGQVLFHGVSAGGVGATAGMLNRRDIGSRYAYLINDSGPMMLADRRVGTTEDYADQPSAEMHRTITASWGLEKIWNYIINDYLPGTGGDPHNYGTIYGAMARGFPNDRFAFTTFKGDEIFSRFSYASLKGYQEAQTKEDKLSFLLEQWNKDIKSLENYLNGFSNFGYFHPTYRSLIDSHTSTSFTFLNSDIEESGLKMRDFVHNVLHGKGDVMQASEQDADGDYYKNVCLVCIPGDDEQLAVHVKEWALDLFGKSGLF